VPLLSLLHLCHSLLLRFEGLLRNYFFFVPQQSLGLIKYSGVCVQPKPQPFMVRVLRFCSHGISEVERLLSVSPCSSKII
jgi:hypothetical protein